MNLIFMIFKSLIYEWNIVKIIYLLLKTIMAPLFGVELEANAKLESRWLPT